MLKGVRRDVRPIQYSKRPVWPSINSATRDTANALLLVIPPLTGASNLGAGMRFGIYFPKYSISQFLRLF